MWGIRFLTKYLLLCILIYYCNTSFCHAHHESKKVSHGTGLGIQGLTFEGPGNERRDIRFDEKKCVEKLITLAFQRILHRPEWTSRRQVEEDVKMGPSETR